MTDIGIQFVNSIYAKMMVDDPWSLRRERGFTWWAFRLAQHIEVGPPVSDGELDVCVVRIWTEVARDVNARSNPAQVLGAINTQQTLNALAWDPENGVINEHCTAFVHKENVGWLSNLVATAAVMQNTAAHSRAHAIARACGGVPAATNHPSSGHRQEMDDILNVPERLVVSAGAEPSRFAGPMIEKVLDFLTYQGIRGQTTPTELRCTVPFSDHRTAITMMAAGESPPMSSIQILTDAPHPEAGNGALVLMWIPVSPGDAAEAANALNMLEATGNSQVPLLGAWCPDPTSRDQRGISFCSFLPNLIARQGMLENQVLYQRNRSTFASQWFSAQG